MTTTAELRLAVATVLQGTWEIIAKSVNVYLLLLAKTRGHNVAVLLDLTSK